MEAVFSGPLVVLEFNGTSDKRQAA